MLTNQTPLQVGMLLYPGFTMLDLVGPLTVFSMHSKLYLFWKSLEPVVSDSGISMIPTNTLQDCPAKLDILFVPGGFGTDEAIKDNDLISFLKDVAPRANFLTSVCSGSLMLGAAGLLEGFEATTHWLSHDRLTTFGAVPVKARVVKDRNRVTGGGVTAGIDFGFTLLAQLKGETAAKAVQLAMEYDPQPLFDVGSPNKAGEEIIKATIDLINQGIPNQIMYRP